MGRVCGLTPYFQYTLLCLYNFYNSLNIPLPRLLSFSHLSLIVIVFLVNVIGISIPT